MEDANIFFNLPDVANLNLPDPDLRSFYYDLNERVIWLDTEIGTDTRYLEHYIMEWNREDKGKPIEERKPIRILIASPGGALDVADGIVSIIRLSKTPVWGVAMECVASAASLIYLACHKKLALPNGYFIFHQGSCSNMGGNYAEIKAAMDDYQEQVERMTKYYIENTNYTEDEVRKNIQKDWYIHTTEGLEKGIIDELVSDIDDII